MVVCELKNSVATVYQDLPSPQGRTIDDMLRGEWFGLTATFDDKTHRLLEKYRKLVEKRAGKAELIVYDELLAAKQQGLI